MHTPASGPVQARWPKTCHALNVHPIYVEPRWYIDNALSYAPFAIMLATGTAFLALAAAAIAAPKSVPAGFVTASGTKFQLDGKDFYFAGSNAYYLPFNNVRSEFLEYHAKLLTTKRIKRASSLAWELQSRLA